MRDQAPDGGEQSVGSERDFAWRCRRLLLQWLIRTTRARAVWQAERKNYFTAGDGKESNAAGPALRLARGQVNYL